MPPSELSSMTYAHDVSRVISKIIYILDPYEFKRLAGWRKVWISFSEVEKAKNLVLVPRKKENNIINFLDWDFTMLFDYDLF